MPFVVEVLKKHDRRYYAKERAMTMNPSADNAWENLLTVSGALKLAKPSLVIINCQFTGTHNEHTNVCCQNSCVRIGFKDSAGNQYNVGSYGKRTYNTTETWTYDFQGFAFLPAETYDLLVDIAAYDYSYVKNLGFNRLYVSSADLEDLAAITQRIKTETVAAKSRKLLETVNIDIPIRNSVIGPINKAMLFIFMGVDAKWWYGDGAASDWIGFQFGIDGAWIAVSKREMTTYMELTKTFHWAQYWTLVDAGKTHNISFRFSNGTDSSQTATAHYGVIACPWLIPQDDWYELIDIEVPVGSTIYGVVEDFFDRSRAKYAAIRSTNLMNGQQSITEFTQDPGEPKPLQFNYTPEWYETEIKLGLKGLWNCLSRLACDLRG